MTSENLHFSPEFRKQIDDYLPTVPTGAATKKLHVTLTYATSLDAQLAIAPNVQTDLSGPVAKAMTHYLRARHDAILVGSGTAMCDGPTLNSRLEDTVGNIDMQPRPVVLDGRARWQLTRESKMIRAAREGRGKGPWVLVQTDVNDERAAILKECGGEYVHCGTEAWNSANVLGVLARHGVRTLMAEGGCKLINELLSKHTNYIDSVIVTLAPVYLGKGGLPVCPERTDGSDSAEELQPTVQFRDVKWVVLQSDAIMCARIAYPSDISS